MFRSQAVGASAALQAPELPVPGSRGPASFGARESRWPLVNVGRPPTSSFSKAAGSKVSPACETGSDKSVKDQRPEKVNVRPDLDCAKPAQFGFPKNHSAPLPLVRALAFGAIESIGCPVLSHRIKSEWDKSVIFYTRSSKKLDFHLNSI